MVVMEGRLLPREAYLVRLCMIVGQSKGLDLRGFLGAKLAQRL
jgi:hypothetical protein